MGVKLIVRGHKRATCDHRHLFDGKTCLQVQREWLEHACEPCVIRVDHRHGKHASAPEEGCDLCR